MAIGAVRDGKGRARCSVLGVVGLLPSGEMAAGIAAISGRNLEFVIVFDVAAGAGHVGVSIRQSKSRAAVIEFGVEPAVKIVAALAIGGCEGRSCACVGRIRGALPILEVAGIALRGESVENSSG